MNTHYPKLMIYSHWLTAALVAVAYISSGHPTRDGLVGEIHIASGLAVATLLLVRLPLRFIYHRNLPQHTISVLQKKAAAIMQYTLYGCMALIPLTGYLALAGETSAFSVFGFALPLSAPAGFSHTVGQIHPLLGNLFLSLAGLHAAAALAHHFYYKDGTLKSMLPFKR